MIRLTDAELDAVMTAARRRPHKSTTLIDVRLAPTSGAKADISSH